MEPRGARDDRSIEELRSLLIPTAGAARWDEGELAQAVLNLENHAALARCEALLQLAVVKRRSLDETSAARAAALREILLELMPKELDHPFCSVLRVLAGLEPGTAGRRREQRQEAAGRVLGGERYAVTSRSVRRRVKESCWPWLFDRLIEREVRERRTWGSASRERSDSAVDSVRTAAEARGVIAADHFQAVSNDVESRRQPGPLRKQAARASSATSARGTPTVRCEDLRHIAAALDDARRYFDTEVVEYFRGQLTECAAADGTHGPKDTLPKVLGIVGAIESRVRHVKASVREDLLAVGAQGAEFVAWLYRDLGLPAAADDWRDRAIEWAQEAGDLGMQAYVLLKRSQAAWDARDAPSMLALAQQVQEGPWPLPAKVRAEAAQQEARGHAMLGDDPRLMEHKLGEAQELLAADDPRNLPESGTQLSSHYGPVLLAMQTAICYSEAGWPGRAVDIYRDQLTTKAFSPRDYGYFLSLMAGAQAAAGEPTEASDTAVAALSIALDTDSTRTVRELQGVAARLEPWRHRPPVRELRGALAEAGAAVNPW